MRTMCYICLLVETVLSLSGRRDMQIAQADWPQLFQSNIDDTLKSEGGSWSPADNNTVTNVTVQLGATAYLHCHVRTTGDHAVTGSEVTCKINSKFIMYLFSIKSWIKHRMQTDQPSHIVCVCR